MDGGFFFGVKQFIFHVTNSLPYAARTTISSSLICHAYSMPSSSPVSEGSNAPAALGQPAPSHGSQKAAPSPDLAWGLPVTSGTAVPNSLCIILLPFVPSE